MESLINKCVNPKNGYIDLSKLGKKAVQEYKPGNTVFKVGDKKYFFKLSSMSGGVNFRNKEIYESLISKILKKYTQTIEYYPAVFNGKKGVVSEHWDNINTGYLPFHKALKIKGYEHAPRIDSVEDFEAEYKMDWDSKGLSNICTADCLDGIRKAPIQLMAGNYDFKLSNMAVRCLPKRKLRNFMSFDYGFNLFNLVDTHLKTFNMPLTKENVAFSINRIVEEWFYINLTLGASKNCCNYDDISDLTYDFYCYAQRNPIFKKNLAISLDMMDDLSDIFKQMKDCNIKLSNYKQDLIKRVMDFWQNKYESIIN